MPVLLGFVVCGWLVGWWVLARGPRLRTVAVAEARATVDVVIPARNEAELLPTLLRALTRQSYLPQRVIVIDDESGDGTAAVAKTAGATVIHSGPVPAGWTGKAWACWQGASAGSSDLLVFLDADTEPGPELLRQLVSEHARLGGLLTVAPYHRVVGIRAPLRAVADVVSGAGGAASSACIVCSRKDYLAVGGHHMVAGSVADGPALARRFLDRGAPVHNRIGRDAIEYRNRPSGGRERAETFARRIGSGAVGHSWARTPAVTLWVVALVLSVIAAAVAVLGITTDRELVVGVVAYAACAAQLGVVLPRVGSFEWWTAALFPIPLVVFLVTAAWSGVLRLRRRVAWKGRSINQHAPPGSSTPTPSR